MEPARVTTDLGTRAVRGVAWLGGGQLLRQGIGFITTITLTRLLAPEDFGLFAMTYVAVEFAQLVTNFGFGAAIVQRQVSSPAVLSTCFWLNILLAAVVAAVMLASAPALAGYFGRTELVGLMLPLSLNVAISAAMVVPQALLTMRMQFRQIIMAQTLGSIVAAVVVVTAAVHGLGYWSLALQPLVGSAVTCLAMMFQGRWWPGRQFAWREVRGMMDFSGFVLLGSLVSFLARSMPTFVIGRVLGSSALALYGLASGITGTIIYQVSSVIVRVLFPALSSIKDDPPRLRAAWSRATAGIAAVAMPVMAGVAATAEDFVVVVLGAQWVDAAGPLRFLCVAMAVQSVLTTSGTVLLSLGCARTGFVLSLIGALGYGLALWLGVQHSLEGAAIGYMVACIALNLLTTVMACRAARVPALPLLAELAPWAIGASAAAAGMALVMQWLPGWPPLARLLAASGAGTVVYVAVIALLARDRAWSLAADIGSRFKR
jgi:O-antigen/teichoic acid export membrane protein